MTFTPAVDHRVRTMLACLSASLALFALTARSADAGEYVMAQCDPVNRGYLDAEFDRNNGGDYAFGKHCHDGGEGYSLQVRNISAAPNGRRASVSWLAPTGSRLVAVSAEARLRRDSGHRARIRTLDAAGRPAEQLANGLDEAGGFEPINTRLAAPRAGLTAMLVCESSDRCPYSAQARTWIRHLRLTFDDWSRPALALDGSLLAPQWLRGPAEVSVDATDLGAGLRQIVTTVNGAAYPSLSRTLACALAGSSAIAIRSQPCPLEQSLATSVETDTAPFRNGSNQLRVCVADFGAAANEHCVARVIRVDNEPPLARFADNRDPEDPELIAAAVSDQHSGANTAAISYRPQAGGEWRALDTHLGSGVASARVDSSAEPAGRYIFAVAASDVAGNVSVSTLRADGRNQVLSFPLRETSRLTSRIGKVRLKYGESAKLSGRLIDGRGHGLAGQGVVVEQRFLPGSSPASQARVVRSDPAGRYQMRLAAGPSRRVVVRYAGTRRYLSASSPSRKLAVAGKARLRIERQRVAAGRRARFRGRIGRAGAAIPAPGKVVELQVRATDRRRWRTVRQALHTDSRGRLRTSYSFERFYSEPTRFQFRLKLTRQAGWPYRGPAHSRPQTLTVIPR